MLDLFVLDRSLQRIGIVSDYETLVWTSNIWEHSRASLRCEYDPVLDQAVFLERTDTAEAMMVTRRHVTAKGRRRSVELECLGATLLLERRVNWWTHNFVGVNLAAACATMTADAIATQGGIDRSIDGLLALEDLTVTTHAITKQVSWGSVATAIFDLVRAAGFSFGVRYTPAGLQPFVRRGADWSSAVVFSEDFDDVSVADLDIDSASRANLAVVGGQGEGASRVVTTVAVSDGEELAELWIDADDLAQGSLTSGQYLDTLVQRGAEKLGDAPITRSFEVSVTDDRYRYRQDYSLGDTVGYRALGHEGSDIVSSVTEVIEGGDVRLDLTLGVAAPTIRKLIV